MDTPLVLAGEFDTPTAEGWRQAVDKVLARKDGDVDAEELDRRFRKQLVATTYDGIDIQPLYTPSDVPGAAAAIGVPGSWPYVRGTTPLGAAPTGWDVRQVVDLGEPPADAARLALDGLERGATSLLLRAPAGLDVDTDRLAAALEGVYLDLVTVALDTALGRDAATALLGLWERRGIDPTSASGVLGLDPLGVAASTGASVEDDDLRAAQESARTAAESWPGVRSWVVDTTRYHDAGASDTQELAYATATGVQYLRWLVDGGLDAEAALGQLEFRLAATCDQFATIAKLRAARRLWARVAEVVGHADAGGQRQHALTSRAMLTRYDPAVNLLRNTIAAFAAGVGGAGALTVELHDLWSGQAPTDLARRMARNTQLLLIEESHLARVIDPAAGSSYVESLTDTMAAQAWEGFQEIEAAGGMATAVGSGSVREAIERTWVSRVGNLARRVDTVVGVSDFPNADEHLAPAESAVGADEPDGALPRRRWAQAFEALRERVDAVEAGGGTRPAVLILRVGPEAASADRSTYIGNFFASAGLGIARHALDPAAGADGVRQAATEAGARLVCLCSSDALLAEDGSEALSLAGQAGFARTYVATSGPVGETLVAAGADELIHRGCDVLAALTRALDALEVP